MITFKFSEQELIETIAKFFEEEIGICPEVKIKNIMDFVSGGETYQEPQVILSGKIEALGKEKTFTKKVSAAKLTAILTSLLEKEGYKDVTIEYKMKLDGLDKVIVNAAPKLTETRKR